MIQKRLGVQAVCTPGQTGQFDVIVDGKRIAQRGGNWFTRKLGAGYPDLASVVEQIAKESGSQSAG